MVTLMFLLMGAVFTALAGDAYSRGRYGIMALSGLYATYCFGYYVSVVGTLP